MDTIASRPETSGPETSGPETSGPETSGPETPRHLRAVGWLSLVWNLLGVVDFTMTNLRVPAYVVHLEPDLIDYIDGFPFWVIAAWAIGVGCALVGSLLLLDRSRRAAYAFALSLVGMAASQIYQFAMGLPASMTSTSGWLLTAVIWIAAVAQLRYALRFALRMRAPV